MAALVRPRHPSRPTAIRASARRTLAAVYRFALQPKWILSHLFVLALVVTMINLGLWQAGKYEDKKAANKVVRERLAAPIADIASVIRPTDPYSKATALQNRPVRVSGVFEADQMLVRGRSLDQEPGSWVLTPLRRSDGSLVIVNRGWIRNDGSLTAVPAYEPVPTGTVTVTGLLQPTVTRDQIGPTDPPTGHLTNLARADIARYARQLDGPVVPAWVQLRTLTPPQVASPPARRVPTVLGPPELDQGPYFSYAVQWFIFTTIALVGYPLILRRNAREKALDRLEDDDAGPGPDPVDDHLPVGAPTR